MTIIVISGLQGAGKSSLARKLCSEFDEATHVDADLYRAVYWPHLRYDAAARLMACGSLAKAAEAHPSRVVVVSVMAPTSHHRYKFASRERKTYFAHCDCSIRMSIQRDTKGLYASRVSNMAGVDLPYEVPRNPDFRLRTDAGTFGATYKKLKAWYETLQLESEESKRPNPQGWL